MIDSLFRGLRGALPALETLVGAAERMPKDAACMWRNRFLHVYGELGGQRKVDVGQLRRALRVRSPHASVHAMLFAAHTWFVLVADLIAWAALDEDPARALGRQAAQPRRPLALFLRNLSRGFALADRGVSGAQHAFRFDWYVDACTAAELDSLRRLLSLLAERWSVVEAARASLDPLRGLYTSVLPRNLLHILGEVYTPVWLAQSLLQASGWRPGVRLLDPFGGSGVFVLAALQRGVELGIPPTALLHDMCLVDLNPIACAAARANLVLFLARHAARERAHFDVSLPVLCADAIAPCLPSADNELVIDGELVGIPGRRGASDTHVLAAQLARYGLRLPGWIPCDAPAAGAAPSCLRRASGTADRRLWEQLAVQSLRKADVVATNPPWVGWEYMARAYRTRLEPAWKAYGLFTARGRSASFLKEDLSTLALTVAWDRYLRAGGRSVTVLRSSAMTSTLASQGLRRLSLRPDGEPLRLGAIQLFEGIKVFPNAQVEAATWLIEKGAPTGFPVQVSVFSRTQAGYQPPPSAGWPDVSAQLGLRLACAERVIAQDAGSRWVVGDPECVTLARRITGTSHYVARTGVFTGGANAVYYLQQESRGDELAAPWYRNVVEGAKRPAPAERVRLEAELVYDVIRGRDLSRWHCRPGGQLLCPHTRETRMAALPPDTLRTRYPRTWAYLAGMRPVLDQRNGFTAWERAFREQAFYALQRIGDYTFAPHKVVWRYIASDFIVAVLGPSPTGKPRLPNDKVMFVGVDDAQEAHFLCGVLSSAPVRWMVTAFAASTQISASAIAPLHIPKFDPCDTAHVRIARCSEAGHDAARGGDFREAASSMTRLNEAVRALWHLGEDEIAAFRMDLARKQGEDWSLGTPHPAMPIGCAGELPTVAWER